MFVSQNAVDANSNSSVGNKRQTAYHHQGKSKNRDYGIPL
jgi:hypothetical protein